MLLPSIPTTQLAVSALLATQSFAAPLSLGRRILNSAADFAVEARDLITRASSTYTPDAVLPYLIPKTDPSILDIPNPVLAPPNPRKPVNDLFQLFYTPFTLSTTLSRSDLQGSLQYLSQSLLTLNYTFPTSTPIVGAKLGQSGTTLQLTRNGSALYNYNAPPTNTTTPQRINFMGGAGPEFQAITEQLQAQGEYRVPYDNRVGKVGYPGYINRIISDGVGALQAEWDDQARGVQGAVFAVVQMDLFGGTVLANGTVADLGYFGS